MIVVDLPDFLVGVTRPFKTLEAVRPPSSSRCEFPAQNAEGVIPSRSQSLAGPLFG